VQGYLLLAVAQPYIDLARLGLQHQERPGELEPMFEALARAATTDPLGDLKAVFSKVLDVSRPAADERTRPRGRPRRRGPAWPTELHSCQALRRALRPLHARGPRRGRGRVGQGSMSIHAGDTRQLYHQLRRHLDQGGRDLGACHAQRQAGGRYAHAVRLHWARGAPRSRRP